MHILRLSILSLTLALAVMSLGYVTPLQAQVCDLGAFCDRDGDMFFKDHKRCGMCGGVTDCDDSVFSDTNDCANTDPAKKCEDVSDYGVHYHGRNVHGTDLGDEINCEKYVRGSKGLHIYGHGGHDILIGSPGDDHLIGGDGDDILFGGEGKDGLHGGPGMDECWDEGSTTDFTADCECINEKCP